MDYSSARRVGDEAEGAVARKLEVLRSQYGFSVLNDVLVGKPGSGDTLITAQIDHIVVDHLGALVIETKTRRGAFLRGTYADSKWTACYPGRRNETFQNPLRQNDQHVNLLRQVLRDNGLELDFDQIRPLTVFVDTDISTLELDSVSQDRVTSIDGLEAAFATRYDFAFTTPLTPEAVACLSGAIRELDRSGSSEFESAHSLSRGGVAAPVSAGAPHTQIAPVPPPSSRGNVANQPVSLRLVGIALATAVGTGFVLWAAYAFMTDTAPSWLWWVLIVILALLGGEGGRSSRRRRKRRRSSHPAEPATLVEPVLAALFILAITAIIALVAFQMLRASAGNGLMAPASGASLPASPAADVGLAGQRLREVDPELYASLANPNTPKVTQGPDGLYTYQWEYLSKRGQKSAQVLTVSVTLGANGEIVGVSN